jgi:hypothetical protein
MVAGFWTLDRTTITGRSAVILRQHTTPFRPMIVPNPFCQGLLIGSEADSNAATR